MIAPWLVRGLALLACMVLLGSGCRRKRPAAEAPPPVPAAAAEAAPNLPAEAQPKPGQAMPAMTTEMMLRFEARFGRPPTNYNELARLQSEPPRK